MSEELRPEGAVARRDRTQSLFQQRHDPDISGDRRSKLTEVRRPHVASPEIERGLGEQLRSRYAPAEVGGGEESVMSGPQVSCSHPGVAEGKQQFGSGALRWLVPELNCFEGGLEVAGGLIVGQLSEGAFSG